MAWVLANWKLTGILFLGTLIMGWTTLHYRDKAIELENENAVLSSQLENITKNTKKVIYVRTKTASLPVGGAATQLLQEFSRDSK